MGSANVGWRDALTQSAIPENILAQANASHRRGPVFAGRHPRRRTRFALALSLAVCAGAASACQTAIDVTVQSEADGRGVVEVRATLDNEAAAATKAMGMTFRSDDLRAAGWIVDAPRESRGGELTYRVSRSVENADEATAALISLGPPFSSFVVERDHALIRTTYRVRGTVDLRSGLETFGDDILRQRLGSTSAIGLDTQELERQLGGPAAKGVAFTVHADVPGAAPRLWATPLGTVTTIALAGTIVHLDTIVPLAIALVAAILCILLLAAQLRVRARRSTRPGRHA